ncbi:MULTISPECIES: KinB sensor domain-containing domain [Pseudomonas]|jgi:NtrC-family two-component system sensor histidine kinase KinB|uniref:histidine kinase n=1 Tax=Pseudomonas putida TaxID=303 RepID=A0A379KF00_PSEPU|nr:MULTISPECIES: KinB sensor domain-containing domain [Pseudomonas]KAF1309764.1 PAS domain-containing sensor histidine kinase [Pseudomonas sp. SG-MS2]NSX22561.1 PAS domain-containing protein [Pseudomonas putida]NWC79118.1 PAS domain-containing protein [Pseudomonas putida]SUD66545.1 multi-sensor signal transduction histidine kinase [Pseudomonas putida]GLH33826.1 PAS domain-containing sensor histidine kinase [Pseudomonas sp. BR1R-5]
MKWPMKLRTRLFLSISALITVALLGLMLGLVSVLQMTAAQQASVSNTTHVLEIGLKLRQNLGEQLMLILDAQTSPQSLRALQDNFQDLLDQGLAQGGERTGFNKASSNYQAFLSAYRQSPAPANSMGADQPLGAAFNQVRTDLIDSHKLAIDYITRSEQLSRDRALLVSGVLGLTGLVVLMLGFFTAHNIARRFGQPIEALAKAADQLGQGNFDVTLPVSQAIEVNQLTRRFGLMAEALRKHQETNVDELLAGQQRLQAVLDSIDDGLLIIDRQGNLEHLNPVAQRQLGWSNNRLGSPLAEALQRPELEQQLRQVLRGGSLDRPPEDLSIEVDEESRLLSYSLTPVSHPQGPILGAVMVLHDVTEQRAFERVRSEFVLRASHELRTPVTGMHMAFGLLRERVKFPPEARENDLLETIGEEMQRLTQLINDLLNFSRYQSGLQKLELAPCAIDELLERAQVRFSEQASVKQIELIKALEPPLPRIQADIAQLDRVLDNLLHNAIRHTGSGGRIRLHARRHAERVIISVEDNGEGIAYGQQGRIFEPFVQVGRKKGGAGLGLALCKEIVQLHGGRMGVFSRPGQGTQFYMALPV